MFSQLYKKSAFPYILIIAVTILSTLILWLPFITRITSIGKIQTPGINFETILKHWDGPLYIIAAKTMYDPTSEILQKSPLGLSPKYFAAHLPTYPVTIRVLATILGFPKAMLVATLISSIFLFCFFYYFVKKLKLSDNPLVLTLIFTMVTPRFLVVRSIGSPEPMFLLFILSSLFFFIKEKYFWAGLFGALAVMTKTPGIILFGGYCLYLLSEFSREKRFDMQWLWIILIPAGLFGVFALYARQYGDFLAYFHSGDNIHLVFPPFSVFNYQKEWIGTGWLEEIIFLYFLYLYTLITLIPNQLSFWQSEARLSGEGAPRISSIFFYFSMLFFIAIISVEHRDISRYSLPLLPIALITFEKFFTSKQFRFVLILLLPAIYLYSWNFMLVNVAPITDWGPFL